jgi:hypothetical protein
MMFSGFNSVLLIKLLEQRFHVLPQRAQADALYQVSRLFCRAPRQLQPAGFLKIFQHNLRSAIYFYRVPGSFSTVALIVSHS